MTLPPRTIRTPEGLDLQFATAGAAERIVAFAFDALLLAGTLLLAALLLLPTLGPAPVLLLVFCVRQVYFAWFEVRWGGRTPGKRRYGLRVIRADGGPLTTEAVLARNLARELELFLPLQIVWQPEAYHGGHIGPIALLASLWVLILLFFPLTNRHRLRIGDLLAGTCVVVAPAGTLLRDLAAPSAAQIAAATGEPQFRPAHLQVYGIKELQVLEDVLRKAKTPGGKETLDAVARSIKKRIGWSADDGPPLGDYDFLRAFYTAQRRHLEQHLLLGKRREHKNG